MADEIKSILLAEDDPDDVKLVLEALAEQKLANAVAVVRDGREALDYLRREGPFAAREKNDPVVVLLDMKMPKMDGIEVLRAMKTDENLKTIPVVMLTSSQEPAGLAECYKLGANAYVVKPVKFEDFIKLVKSIGLFWALINEPPPASAGLK